MVLVVTVIGPSTAQANPGWYNASWQYRKKITINSANVSDNLTNFPVLISLTSDGNLASDAQNDGDDILFTAADEVTKLSHEIESFNGTSGQLVAWVKIPSLSAVTDTEIYMYYGNVGASNSENVTNVWDANFKMVQHLEESIGGTDNITDSTSNNNDGTDYNSPTFGATGQMDGAIGFDGGSDYVDTGSSFQTTFRGGFSVSVWIKPTDGQPAAEETFTGSSNVASEDRINLQVLTTGKTLIAYESNNNVARASTNTAVLSDGQEGWHHIVFVADNTTGGVGGLKIYFDGTEQTLDATYNGDTSGITFADWTSADELFVGAYDNDGVAGSHFNGAIDEFRISDTVRSSGWIQTSYNNQSNPSDFITLGSQEAELSAPAVTTDAATSVEETTATLNGTLTDDGGEGTQYRFEYDTDSGSPYTFFTSWSSNITSVQSFSTGISSLSKGTKYYFRAQAKNSIDTSSGSELTFLTKPDEPTALSATANSSSRIDLSWTKGAGANNTMVRRKQGSHPTSVSDGSEVYFSTGDSTSDTSLSASTTYFYSAWSEVSGSQQYSDAYATANATTPAAAEAPIAIGGEVFPVDKPRVLAPWLFLFLMLSMAVAVGVLNWRRSNNCTVYGDEP